jgi:hypothetical protein
MSHPQSEGKPPWYPFDGFTFVVTGQAAKVTVAIRVALSSRQHVQRFGDVNVSDCDLGPKTLALVNLCVLFKTLIYFKPYMALPGFWTTVDDKWGLLSEYRATRLLIHMYSGARGTFLAEKTSVARVVEDRLSSLSKTFADLVDEWRVTYDDYFELRTKAYEDPDGEMVDEFRKAEHDWSFNIGLWVGKLLGNRNMEHRDDDDDSVMMQFVVVPSNSFVDRLSSSK